MEFKSQSYLSQNADVFEDLEVKVKVQSQEDLTDGKLFYKLSYEQCDFLTETFISDRTHETEANLYDNSLQSSWNENPVVHKPELSILQSQQSGNKLELPNRGSQYFKSPGKLGHRQNSAPYLKPTILERRGSFSSPSSTSVRFVRPNTPIYDFPKPSLKLTNSVYDLSDMTRQNNQSHCSWEKPSCSHLNAPSPLQTSNVHNSFSQLYDSEFFEANQNIPPQGVRMRMGNDSICSFDEDSRQFNNTTHEEMKNTDVFNDLYVKVQSQEDLTNPDFFNNKLHFESSCIISERSIMEKSQEMEDNFCNNAIQPSSWCGVEPDVRNAELSSLQSFQSGSKLELPNNDTQPFKSPVKFGLRQNSAPYLKQTIRERLGSFNPPSSTSTRFVRPKGPIYYSPRPILKSANSENDLSDMTRENFHPSQRIPEKSSHVKAASPLRPSNVHESRRNYSSGVFESHRNVPPQRFKPRMLNESFDGDTREHTKSPYVEENDRRRRFIHWINANLFKERFVDTHCHLDFLIKDDHLLKNFKAFKKHCFSIASDEAFPVSFEACVAVFCYPPTFQRISWWTSILANEEVWGAFGCHPHFADLLGSCDELFLEFALNQPKVKALGEIGLDYSYKNSVCHDVQKSVFRMQLQLAIRKRKPIVLHCRDATEDCMEIMKSVVPQDHIIHHHCFTGDLYLAKQWLVLFPNMYFGFTCLVTEKSSRAFSAKGAAMGLPLDRILLETDAPYFRPPYLDKSSGSKSHPGMAIHVAFAIAKLRRITVDEVLEKARKNTRDVYGI